MSALAPPFALSFGVAAFCRPTGGDEQGQPYQLMSQACSINKHAPPSSPHCGSGSDAVRGM